MGRIHDDDREIKDFAIRVPLNMIQLTEHDGKAWPLAFDWKDEVSGEVIQVNIEHVVSMVPDAEQKSGAVGDRYECIINGQPEYLYYTILQPRKWFKLVPVSEAEYKAYYKLPGESAANKSTKEKWKYAAEHSK